MSGKLKQVAKEISRLEGCYEGCQHCRNIAKAVIEVMHDPTVEMIQAAKVGSIQDCYNSMIDVALKE